MFHITAFHLYPFLRAPFLQGNLAHFQFLFCPGALTFLVWACAFPTDNQLN